MNSVLFVRLDLPSNNLWCLGWGLLVQCWTLWCLWFSRVSNHSLLLVGVLGCWHWWSAAAHANGWSATDMLYCSWHSISFVELGLKFLHAANVPYRLQVVMATAIPLDAECLILTCIVLGLWCHYANKRWWCLTAWSNWGTSHCTCANAPPD